MTPVLLREFLSGTPFFGGLNQVQLDFLALRLKARDALRGETIFREGEQGRSMYLVESGALMARQAGVNVPQFKLMRFHVGEFFGETTLIEMQPRPFTVTVESDARLHELTNVDLYALYKHDIEGYVLVVQNMNRELCRRLRSAGQAIAQKASDEDVTQITTPLPPLHRR